MMPGTEGPRISADIKRARSFFAEEGESYRKSLARRRFVEDPKEVWETHFSKRLALPAFESERGLRRA